MNPKRDLCNRAGGGYTINAVRRCGAVVVMGGQVASCDGALQPPKSRKSGHSFIELGS